MKKSDESLHDLWDTIKRTNLWIIKASEGEEGENRAESLFKDIMAENLKNLRSDLYLQTHEAHSLPNKSTKGILSKKNYNKLIKN